MAKIFNQMNNAEIVAELVCKTANKVFETTDFRVTKTPIVLNGRLEFYRFDAYSDKVMVYFPYVVVADNFIVPPERGHVDSIEEMMREMVDYYKMAED